MNPLADYPRARRWVYLVWSVLGLGLGAAQVGYASAQVGQPAWLAVAQAVFGFLSVGIGYTAAANVPPDAEVPAVDVNARLGIDDHQI